jgi:hypothetical protein
MRRAIKTCKHNIILTDAVVNVYVTDFPVVKVHVDELIMDMLIIFSEYRCLKR